MYYTYLFNASSFFSLVRIVEVLVCSVFSTCVAAVAFEEDEDPSNRSFFSEIVSSISDVHFSRSGMYMATRDYMSLKVWDIRVESRAVECYSVHDYLRSKLCTLYENDSIFDKFQCIWSNNDRLVVSVLLTSSLHCMHSVHRCSLMCSMVCVGNDYESCKNG